LVHETGRASAFTIFASVIGLLLLTTGAIAATFALMALIVPQDASFQDRKGWVAMSMLPILPVLWLWKKFLFGLVSNSKENKSDGTDH
jgi:membrane protein implicated in regulation of membrane protease activity